MKAVSKWLFYLLLFPAFLAFSGWQGWSWWSWAVAPPQASAADAPDSEVQIQIPQGATAQEIGEDLKAVGLIRSLDAWNVWTRWQSLGDRSGSFQAGTYAFSPGQSMQSIADQIWRGQVVERGFTIPEGWSIQQMADYFAGQGLFSAQEFIAATKQVPRDKYPWLPEGLPMLEGFLYPDTYELPRQPTPQAVIEQMLDRFQQVALPAYQQAQAQGQTAYSLLQWVTLASIVEKEAVIDTERPQIASVFAKRLREGMVLGADPTVEYALGIRQTPDQPLTLDQVRTPSPYNTYVNAGLPPTPIASPGLSSLKASLNPDDTDYLYFVARYDGTHVFSKTLEEHEAAQAQIQDGRAAQQQPKPDASAPSPTGG